VERECDMEPLEACTRFLPESLLKEVKDMTAVGQELAGFYKELSEQCDAAETRSKSTSRVLEEMQRMQVFAVSWWAASWLQEVPDTTTMKKESMLKPPEAKFELFPTGKNSFPSGKTFYVCGDATSVRFVLPGTEGELSVHTFTYSKDAPQHVVDFEASADVVQFILQDGTETKRLILRCPAGREVTFSLAALRS